MWIRVVTASAALLAAGGVQPGSAAQPAGNAVAVVQSANVEGGGGSRVLEVKAPVFMGDKVKTGKSGQAQLLFLDKTRMVVGPGSQLAIDSFVYQGGGATARQFTISAVKGAFRFITGASAKQAYVIRTPTATIGVRGTRFDFTVNRDGTTNLALYEGGVRLCDRATPRHCTVLTGSCSVIVLAPKKDFRWVKNINERADMFRRLFPYAFSQASLRRDFRVASGGCNVTYSDEPLHHSPNTPAAVSSPPSAAPSAPPSPPPSAPSTPPSTPPSTSGLTTGPG